MLNKNTICSVFIFISLNINLLNIHIVVAVYIFSRLYIIIFPFMSPKPTMYLNAIWADHLAQTIILIAARLTDGKLFAELFRCEVFFLGTVQKLMYSPMTTNLGNIWFTADALIVFIKQKGDNFCLCGWGGVLNTFFFCCSVMCVTAICVGLKCPIFGEQYLNVLTIVYPSSKRL